MIYINKAADRSLVKKEVFSGGPHHDVLSVRFAGFQYAITWGQGIKEGDIVYVCPDVNSTNVMNRRELWAVLEIYTDKDDKYPSAAARRITGP